MHLLADISDFVPLIVGAIALIGWIANKVKEAGGAAGGVGADVQDAAAGNDAGRVQAEIDRFLQQVRGGVGQAAENAVERPVEPARQPARQPEPQAARSAESEGLSKRHVIGDRHIDTDVDDHVFAHLPKGRVADLVEEDLGHEVERSVSSHMGSAFDTDVEPAENWEDGGSGLTAEALVGLLSRPEGIRQAVVVQEILSRPKGRRGRRGRRGL